MLLAKIMRDLGTLPCKSMSQSNVANNSLKRAGLEAAADYLLYFSGLALIFDQAVKSVIWSLTAVGIQNT